MRRPNRTDRLDGRPPRHGEAGAGLHLGRPRDVLGTSASIGRREDGPTAADLAESRELSHRFGSGARARSLVDQRLSATAEPADREPALGPEPPALAGDRP